MPLRHTIASSAQATHHSRKWLDGVSDALAYGLRLLRDLRPLRHSGHTPAPTPTGDYAPSLRSPWRAANEQNVKKATKKQKEFKSYASAFPPMILMNGLGQASAFYLSKGGTHEQLYQLLSDWLKLSGQPFSGQDLMDGIAGNNVHCYRVAQAEALLLLDWVKKFANAYVRED